MPNIRTTHNKISIKVGISLGFLMQLLSKKMVQLGALNDTKCLTWTYLFLQLLALWLAHIGGWRMLPQCVNEGITRGFVFALALTLILPMSQDGENLTGHGAIHSVSKCCQPAHSSNQEQPWFMLPLASARDVESYTADLFIAESLKIE